MKRSSWRAGLAVIAVLAAVRLPLAGPWVIDWDESTFFLMGHEILSGRLPYLDVWDNKPPLLYGLVAAIQALSFETIFGARLIITGVAALLAVQIKHMADAVYGPAIGHWLAGLAGVAAITALRSGAIVGGEILALPFFMGAMLLWMGAPLSLARAAWIGALFAAAALIRPNFGVAAAVLVVGLCGVAVIQRKPARLGAAAVMGLAGVAVAALVAAPFVLLGAGGDLYHSTITAVLAQSAAASAAAFPPYQVLETILEGPALLVITVLAGAGVVVGLRRSGATAQPDARLDPALTPQMRAWRLLLGAAAAVFAALNVGEITEHHLIMVVPFFAVLGMAALRSLILAGGWRRVTAGGVVTLLLALAIANAVDRGLLRADPARATYAVIAPHLTPDDTFYLAIDHVLYWRFDATPPHPLVAHPSAIHRPYVYHWRDPSLESSDDVMQRILETEPTWIVIPDRRTYRGDQPPAIRLQDALLDRYVLMADFRRNGERRLVYRWRGGAFNTPDRDANTFQTATLRATKAPADLRQ